MNSLWKSTVLVLILLLFVCVGIGHVVKPEWFLERSSMRKGGEMLTEWNRVQFQIVGVIFAGTGIYFLYILFRDMFSN
jgi:hypothetical protein